MRKPWLAMTVDCMAKNLQISLQKFFSANGIRVYLFDEACPYPELSFAVTHMHADIGIEISASHNDKRYNGYKISNRLWSKSWII